MNLVSLLDIPRGVTAIIGGGGKTTLMEYLADRLPGTALLCTTTHIRRPARFPTLTEAGADEIRAALDRHHAVCVGTAAESGTVKTGGAKANRGEAGKAEAGTAADTGKLTAPRLRFPVLASLADYVLTEADGSRGLPLKAHAPWEPVIPADASRVILVTGLDGIGRPIREACHRAERYAALAGAAAGGKTAGQAETILCNTLVTPDTIVTPFLAARVIAAEGYGDRVFLNKAESAAAVRYGEELADCLGELWPVPVVCGSLWNKTFRRLR